MLRFLLSLWQFPQHLLATIMLLIYFIKGRVKGRMVKGYSVIYEIDKFPGGCSLGPVIFVYSKYYADLVKHECGHAMQSLYLGPLYLLVIGLPSLIWNLTYKETNKHSYYWFYTEKWADKLGGVKRNK